ncbi:MAG: hypothetical protein E3J69_01170 [Anaerolineales bacterium]|nr:MAG: hypothetical protein E3J69_01170 [Anaerolineales bacterium]
MDQATIQKLTRTVGKKFPEMKSVRPSVREQSNTKGNVQFLLTYKGKAELPGGRKISRIVRVVADERGRIIKMSTSK